MAGYAPAPLPSLSLVLGENLALAADQGSLSVTGQSAALLTGRLLSAEQGSYGISGQDATFGAGTPLYPGPLPHLALLGGLGGNQGVSDQGAYTITGQDASFRIGYRLVCDAGFYTLAGQAAIFNVSVASAGDPAPLPHLGLLLAPATAGSYTLTCDTGLYSVAGSEGLADYEMSSAQGAYGVTGQDAALLKTHILRADAGTYAVSGQDVTFAIGSPSRTLTAEQGMYSISGQNAALTSQYKVSAEQGFYALLGQAADVVVGTITNYSMLAEAGSYQFFGTDADFVLGDPVLAAETGYYYIDGQSVRQPETTSPSGGWDHVIRHRRKEREREKRRDKGSVEEATETSVARALKRAVEKPRDDIDPKVVEVIAEQIRRAEKAKPIEPRKPSEEEIALLLILAEAKKQPA